MARPSLPRADRALIQRALQALGIERLCFVIHDASFPSLPEEDLGRGSPYGKGAEPLIELLSSLGFNALQLGPQGRTSVVNASPYDGSLFARSELSVSFHRLQEDSRFGRFLPRERWQSWVRASPGGPDYRYAFAACDSLLRPWAQAAGTSARAFEDFREFQKQASYWLEPDGLFRALTFEHGTDDWRRWPQVDARLLWPQTLDLEVSRARRASLLERPAVADNALIQFLLASQHAEFRSRLHTQGLSLLGDLQIGISHADEWAFGGLFLQNYLLGAPPSRTNPEGQAWGYRVLHPALLGSDEAPGPALEWVRGRVRRMLGEFDGVRVDHPHGWVCPWVYRDSGNPAEAVRCGARLFASPGLEDHPELAAFSLVTPEQLDLGKPRYADDWEKWLSPGQIRQYGQLLRIIADETTQRGRSVTGGALACEVLSTWPLPLREVMRGLGLGRFLVTQKVNPGDPSDLYRSEHARAEDWMMVGTHDTPTLWSVLEAEKGSPRAQARARYLAERLEPTASRRPALARRLASSTEALAAGCFAELFSAASANVSFFFADFFGLTERYNVPGQTDARLWQLRLESGWEAELFSELALGRAVHLPLALAWALHAKGVDSQVLETSLSRLLPANPALPFPSECDSE